MSKRIPHYALLSVIAHFLGFATVVQYARGVEQPNLLPLDEANRVEFELGDPNPKPTPPPSVQTPPPPEQAPPEKPPTEPTPNTRAEALPAASATSSTTATGTGAPGETAGATGATTTGPSATTGPGSNSTSTGTGTVSAAQLLTSSFGSTMAAASAGGVSTDPGPGSGRAPRASYMTRDGTENLPPAEQARVRAGAPVAAALAGSNHMREAGSGARSSRVAGRAMSLFTPTRTVGGLGNAVMGAPQVRMGRPNRQPTAAQSGANGSLDGAHPNSFGTTELDGASIPFSYHLLRVVVEVVQDPTGSITTARVVQSSGQSGLDQHALEVIREAMPADPNPQSPGGRQSRWSFEVSNAASAITTILGNGNEGWRVLAEESNGVKLRMRIRMVSSQALPPPAG